jgi:hypothetical protein
MSVYVRESQGDGFAGSRRLVEGLIGWLGGGDSVGLSHAELEDQLTVRGRELQRQLLQDHLDLRAVREERLPEVIGEDQVTRRHAEFGHERLLATVFGQVSISRIAYRAKGVDSRYPADAGLNLPTGKHSHGLARLAALAAASGSFEQAQAIIERATGVVVGKRQVEALAAAAATDVDAFYTQRNMAGCPDGDVLVLTADAKGIVMRPEALRAATAKTATSRKLSARLSKGEKRGRKRMAEVVAVYHCTPAPRSPEDVIGPPGAQCGNRRAGPKACGKWLHASVTADTASVITAMFDQADRRDPHRQRTCVVLVDGNTHQIETIHATARSRGRPITIVVDFVHVLEYVWKAAWCLHTEGDPAAEAWVAAHASTILSGRATRVAGALQRQATQAALSSQQRQGIDTCVTYLLNKARFMRYHHALAAGWPIATGVIEGACRHLVKDRMDLTGARWGLPGAEAVLKLRSLISNGDFDAYWAYHLNQEKRRIHNSRYTNPTNIR